MRFLLRTRAALALSCLLVVLSIGPLGSVRAAPLLNTMGGPAGFGTNILPANDDGSSAAIDLTPAFPGGLRFFGGPYTQVWVNNNGNITFAGGQSQYTPTAFPIAMRPMIAPYWGDVDTRGGGAPNQNAVFWHLSPGRMVVTWHNVGYFNTHDDKKMDFQMILTNTLDCGSGDFDVEFRYNVCQWTTGDASSGSGGLGGTPAQAGFDAGNLTDFVEIPGSRTAAILNLCTTSNVEMPGIWRFAVRGGEVECPDTGETCTTSGVGACSVGITQCVGREIVCSPVGSMSEERCDGVDNNCDGTIDEGNLCPTGQVCSNGQCVMTCFEGGCLEGFTCTSGGGCVESACVDVECPVGTRCSHGECIGACDGVVCPHGQQCLSGRCADLCDVITCGSGEVCVDGACVATCPCRACAADETCGADGSCTPIGCDLTLCDEGFYCRNGTCLDACAGANCPPGQRCELGQCIDALVDDGPGTPPPPPPDDYTPPPPPPGDAGVGEKDPITGLRTRSGPGCACRAATSPNTPAWIFAGLIGLAVVLVRRRRQR